MSSVKILHAADLHIGAAASGIPSLSAELKAQSVITFEKAVKLAKEKRVDIVLICGDLFHSSYIEPRVVKYVFDCMGQIPDTKIVYVGGNHDPLTPASPMLTIQKPDNLYILGGEYSFFEFPELKTRVYGRSFTETHLPHKAFNFECDDAFINLACLHGEVGGDKSANYNPIDISMIENSGLDYIALGHVHTRTEIKRAGGTCFAYSGCAQGQGFDETGEKGVYIGEISKQSANLEFVRLAQKMYIVETVNVSDCATCAEIADLALAQIKRKYPDFAEHLYKIVLTGDIAEGTIITAGEIAARLSGEVYFAKVIDKTEVALDYEVLRIEKSLRGIFCDKMLQRIAAADDTEKSHLLKALALGCKAFSQEVEYREDN